MSKTNFCEEIKSQIKEAFRLKETTTFKPCSIGLLEEALEDTEYFLGDDLETNGWEQDFWASVCGEDDEVVCNIHGSMYYGSLTLDFEL